ncbi:MAG: ABC-F family ATP-binding cassette domain-containing protein [Mesosutterella sp.]|nr:ABC-F family ATP-binding cassette domain-containing protein [Mesosutterella sp.]
MLRLLDISLARGVRVLYSKASLIASDGERIGLVGPNGCGKSTLFAAVLGELAPESGEIEAPEPDRIAHVAQDIEAVDETALQFVMSGHAPLMRAKSDYAEAKAGGDDMQLAAAAAALAELNEGAISAEAHTILHGLGFTDAQAALPVREFSGGWRNRLALARALMRPADLLLLDEPTNHLDLDSVIWLEAWLKHVRATVVVISHDREFLDRCVSTIWSVEDGTIRRYAGNYSAFEQLRVERLRQQAAGAKAYERTAEHLRAYIERFRYKASKARQAQSRIKMLEKLEAVEPVRARSEWRFEFPAPERLPEHLLDAEGMSLGYEGREVLSGVSFSIRSGERIGVLGVNGAGKSTLVKGLCGELPLMAGKLWRGQGLSIGYFAQHQLDALRLDETPLEHLRRLSPDTREQDLRDFLGGFRFSGDQVNEQAGSMSGGEKARLALALIAWKKPNLLVLDEPTNHLDMETREALTMALSTFGGSVLIVSHDRHLLRAATERLWLVHEGRVTEFEGDLDDYAELVLASRRDEKSAARAAKAASSDAQQTPREARKAAARERARIAELKKPFRKRLSEIESRVAELEESLSELDSRIADPAFYQGSPEEVQAVLKQRAAEGEEKDSLEEEWLEVSEKLEQAGS